MMFLLQVLIAWLLADFITGVVHWIEDRYLGDATSLNCLASISADNAHHHAKPTAMLLSSYWENMKTSAVVAWPIAVMALIAGAPLMVWLSIYFSAFGNLVHRFAHTPQAKVPRWIRGLQEFGIFISPNHHDIHHRYMGQLISRSEASRTYCPMTDWINPVLDRISFWSRVESLLERFGIQTVRES